MQSKSNILSVLLSGSATLLPLTVRAEEAKTGLPQLDTTQYPGQLFWLAISFGLLYVMMRFVAMPAIAKLQDKRRSVLDTDLSAAAKAGEEAKATLAGYEKALADARKQAQSTVNDITAAAAKESAAQQASQQQQLNARLAEAETRIAKMRSTAMQEAAASARDLADTIVDKVSGQKRSA